MFLAFAYLVGSLPTSFLFGKFLKNVDIRKEGSGNVGATNAFRVLGPKIGVTVMAIDIFKGFLPVYLAQGRSFGEYSQLWYFLIGVAAILGHVFTIFLKFRGGKGVATTAGVFVALAPKAALTCVILWTVLVALFKMASVGSIAAASLLPFAIYYFNGPDRLLLGVSTCMSLLVIYMHKKNIKNLINGTELKINSKPPEDKEDTQN